MNEHGMDFNWQEGYGAFSVSASNLGTVERYIADQERHHRKKTYEQEFLGCSENTASHLIPNMCLVSAAPPGLAIIFYPYPDLPVWANS